MEEIELCFLADISGSEKENDLYFGNFQFIWITDLEKFLRSYDDEDLSSIIFWSSIAYRYFISEIKVEGSATIFGEEYDKETFPIRELSSTHAAFEAYLGIEKTEKIKNDITKFENELVKEHINHTRCN